MKTGCFAKLGPGFRLPRELPHLSQRLIGRKRVARIGINPDPSIKGASSSDAH
jgi:hypothetical protein